MVLRRSGLRWFLTGAAVVFALLFVAAITADQSHENSAALVLGTRIFAAVAAAVSAGAAVRIFRQGIFADTTGVMVRNVFRTYRLRWPDIDHFEQPPPYGRRWNAGLRICLKNGAVVPAQLYARGPFSKSSFAAAEVNALNDLHRKSLPH
jgi:hypothetical protein